LGRHFIFHSQRDITVADLFFTGDADIVMRPGWQDNWSTFVAIMNDDNTPPNILAAFYLLDEPNLYNTQKVNDVLSMAIETIRRDFPYTPIATIFAAAALDPFQISLFDWVGQDWNGFLGTDFPSWDEVVRVYNWIRARLTPEQRLIAMPKTFINLSLLPPTCENQATMLANIERFQQEVLSDPTYVLFWPFIWHSGGLRQEGEVISAGVKDLPLVKERLRQLAHTLFW
jgi:hypothetical protein